MGATSFANVTPVDSDPLTDAISKAAAVTATRDVTWLVHFTTEIFDGLIAVE